MPGEIIDDIIRAFGPQAQGPTRHLRLIEVRYRPTDRSIAVVVEAFSDGQMYGLRRKVPEGGDDLLIFTSMLLGNLLERVLSDDMHDACAPASLESDPQWLGDW